jgi:hypothetical protein
VLALGTNNAERVRIDSSGNVGIGTDNPANRFHATQYTANTDVATFQIGSASAYTGFVNCRVGTTGAGSFIGGLYTPDGSLEGLQGTNGLIFSTSGSNLERLRITSAGKVGINTESPRAVLDIEGNAENAILMLHSTDLNANLQFSDNTGGARILNYGGDLAFRTGTNADVFGTGDTEKLRITSGGNVGIGTDNPSTNIHIYDSSQPTIRLDRSDAPRNNFVASWNADELVLAADHANSGGDSRIRFFVDGNEKVRIDDNGNIVMVNSGTGIDFSATGDSSGTASSEILDDYERGFFTPKISFGGSDAGVTYNANNGAYTKVGRLVTCYGIISLTSNGTSTGNAAIFNLPFASNADALSGTSLEGGGHNTYQTACTGTIYGPMSLGVIQNNTFAYYYGATTTGGNMSNMTESNLSNNYDCRFILWYYT